MLNIPLIHEAINDFILTNPTEDYHVHIEKDDKQRPYLGLSGLGGDYTKEHCLKATWMNWRHCVKPTFPSQTLRLFRDGDRFEYEIVWLLRGIGFEVWDVDSEGKQFSVKDYENHVKGNSDGVATAPAHFWLDGYEPQPFLLEFKTGNDANFKKVEKEGVAAKYPRYYDQMISYQGYLKLNLGLFVIKNKNNSALYFENVLSKPSRFRQLVELAGDVISAQTPPDKIRGASPGFWICRWCQFHGICHKGESSQKICRTCKFATPAENGGWNCEKGHEYGVVCEDWTDITK